MNHKVISNQILVQNSQTNFYRTRTFLRDFMYIYIWLSVGWRPPFSVVWVGVVVLVVEVLVVMRIVVLRSSNIGSSSSTCRSRSTSSSNSTSSTSTT